jgi:murein DD-endopeptidase MepM/ murein hydrolase activator NlpD
MKWRHPFAKKMITSRFGVTSNRLTSHRGLDYGPKEGHRIPAASSGTVVMNKKSAVLGWVLVQSAWDNVNNRTVFVGYSHMKQQSHLMVGTKIKIGQTIGHVGNTGSASRGAHLHLTIGRRPNSIFIGPVMDPESFIDGQVANA